MRRRRHCASSLYGGIATETPPCDSVVTVLVVAQTAGGGSGADLRAALTATDAIAEEDTSTDDDAAGPSDPDAGPDPASDAPTALVENIMDVFRRHARFARSPTKTAG